MCERATVKGRKMLSAFLVGDYSSTQVAGQTELDMSTALHEKLESNSAMALSRSLGAVSPGASTMLIKQLLLQTGAGQLSDIAIRHLTVCAYPFKMCYFCTQRWRGREVSNRPLSYGLWTFLIDEFYAHYCRHEDFCSAVVNRRFIKFPTYF